MTDETPDPTVEALLARLDAVFTSGPHHGPDEACTCPPLQDVVAGVQFALDADLVLVAGGPIGLGLAVNGRALSPELTRDLLRGLADGIEQQVIVPRRAREN